MIGSERHPVVRTVIRDLICMISEGKYGPGMRLPSNEQLAQDFGVGRTTMREALKELQALGIVNIRHGEGTFLSGFSGNGPGLLEEIIDLRRMLETHVMIHAVKNRSEEQLNQLRMLFDEMKNTVLNPIRFTDYDREFHIMIAVASGNPLLPNIFRSISGLFAGLQQAIVFLPGSREKALEDHHEMLRALEMQDEAMALNAVHAHLDSIVEQVVEAFEKKGDSVNK